MLKEVLAGVGVRVDSVQRRPQVFWHPPQVRERVMAAELLEGNELRALQCWLLREGAQHLQEQHRMCQTPEKGADAVHLWISCRETALCAGALHCWLLRHGLAAPARAA